MEDENQVMSETSAAQENGETSQNSPEQVLPEMAELKKKAELADNYRARAEKAEKASKNLETELNKKVQSKESSVDALDFIKLGKKLQNYSDAEIDFATEHAKSKSPEAILQALDNEMVQLAINAKREKLEKERLTLKPTGTQADSEQPKSFAERLRNSSIEEKEKLLKEAGLYKDVRPRADRRIIGGPK